MRGDYDDDLQWPFEGDIALELLNWNNDNRHFRGNVSVTDPNGSCTSRVSQREYAPSGWGKNFISHLSLQYNPTEYLQDDCLRLRVVDVAVYSTPLLSKIPSWQDPHTADQSVCDFTLTEFTKRKQFNNVCYSPPFYEYEQGYKMLLHVFMNGQQSARATHISVYAHLMKGEYDDDLDWPFEGIITVELLNWREKWEMKFFPHPLGAYSLWDTRLVQLPFGSVTLTFPRKWRLSLFQFKSSRAMSPSKGHWRSSS